MRKLRPTRIEETASRPILTLTGPRTGKTSSSIRSPARPCSSSSACRSARPLRPRSAPPRTYIGALPVPSCARCATRDYQPVQLAEVDRSALTVVATLVARLEVWTLSEPLVPYTTSTSSRPLAFLFSDANFEENIPCPLRDRIEGILFDATPRQRPRSRATTCGRSNSSARAARGRVASRRGLRLVVTLTPRAGLRQLEPTRTIRRQTRRRSRRRSEPPGFRARARRDALGA